MLGVPCTELADTLSVCANIGRRLSRSAAGMPGNAFRILTSPFPIAVAKRLSASWMAASSLEGRGATDDGLDGTLVSALSPESGVRGVFLGMVRTGVGRAWVGESTAAVFTVGAGAE